MKYGIRLLVRERDALTASLIEIDAEAKQPGADLARLQDHKVQTMLEIDQVNQALAILGQHEPYLVVIGAGGTPDAPLPTRSVEFQSDRRAH